MKKLLRHVLLTAVVCTATGILPIVDQAVMACPGCKTANETDNLRPRAYMLSILFMLGMPATVFAGFGVAFYRMTRRMGVDQATMDEYLRQQAEVQRDQQGSGSDSGEPVNF